MNSPEGCPLQSRHRCLSPPSRHRVDERLSWSCAALRRLRREVVSPHRFSDPAPPFRRPCGVPDLAATAPSRLKSDAVPSVRLRSPSESDQARLPPIVSTAALLGLRSPSAHAAREARSTRVCLTRHLPASGFPTLLPACFFPNLPALFHAGSAHGVSSLQGVSPSQSLRSLSGPVPFVVLASAHLEPRSPSNPTERQRHLQGFALCEDPSPSRWGEPDAPAAALLGFAASREIPLAPARRSRAGSPLELRTPPGTAELSPRVREARCSSGS
jgi:hypothetical protein